MPVPELARMTWRDAKAAFSTARVAIVPVGSTEQHGPHMTLDTDSAIAEAFSRLLCEQLGSDAILCPTLRLGMSEHHLAFAGSLTLRAPTLLALIEDVIESLGHHGMKRVLLVNGHGGNQDALRLAARAAARDKTAEVAAVMWAILAADLIAERAATKRHAHACDIETSVALAIAPEVVLRDRIEAPAPLPAAPPLAEPGARYDIPVPFEQWTSNGSLGDPRLATKELGDEIVAMALSRAVEFARRFIGKA